MANSREMSKEVAAPLLTKSGEEEVASPDETTFCQELKTISSMAAPMVAVTVSQYLLQVVSLMMVGHLGVLVSFSGVAIAISFAEVTGFSVLVNTTLPSILSFCFSAPFFFLFLSFS